MKHFWRKLLILGAVALVSFWAVYLRDPSVFTHSQFWGEDGPYWYGQAYNNGPLWALIQPYAGSLQVGMRIIGAISLLVPFYFVPLFFSVSAVAVQILPVVLLFTDRYQKLVKSIKLTIVLSAFYLLLPNSFEVHANLTNMNWHLALLALMVMVCPGTTKGWRVFDYGVLLIAGLTGPFSIIATPFVYWLARKKKLPKEYFYTVLTTALVQLVVYAVSSSGSRFSQGLGADPVTFFAIIGSRITGALLVSMETVSQYAVDFRLWFAALGLITVAFLAFVMSRAPLFVKLFVGFTWLVYLVALAKPQASSTVPQWQAMLDGAGNRYFWLPMLGLTIGLVWAVCSGPKALKVAAAGLIITSLFVAVPRDFRYTAKPYKNFSESAERFNSAQSGETVCIEVNPSKDWNTCLQKH